MEQVYDDIANPRKKFVEAGRTCFLAQSFLQDLPQQVWHRTKVGRVDSDARKGSAGDVELVAQSDVDIRNLGLAGILSRPLRKGFQQLFRGY